MSTDKPAAGARHESRGALIIALLEEIEDLAIGLGEQEARAQKLDARCKYLETLIRRVLVSVRERELAAALRAALPSKASAPEDG